jgi:hypothetical protein
VIDTSRSMFGDKRYIFGGFLIVAMPMVDRLIVQIVLSAQGGRDTVVNFKHVSVRK